MNSTSTYSNYKLVVEVYIVLPLCVFGMSGNILSIIVLGKDRTVRKTTGFLLQMLALADTVYLTTCLFFQTLNTIDKHSTWIPALRQGFPYMEPYMWPCASIAQTAAVWLVVVVTADRYIAICRPLHAPQYSTISRIRRAVLVVWIFSILYNLPRFFEREIHSVFDNSTNTTSVRVEKTELRENKVYLLVYKTIFFFMLRFFIPLSLLAFFNTKLIQAIKESEKISSKRESQKGRKDTKYTLTLVVVVIVFAICETPDFVLRVWISLNQYIDSLPYHTPTLRYINTISNLFLAINSCVNFVIYCLLGQKFRRIMVQIICVRKQIRARASFRNSLHTNQMEEMTVLVRTTT